MIVYTAGYLIYTPHPIHACMHTCIHEHIATHFTYAHMHTYRNLIDAYIPTSYTTHTHIHIHTHISQFVHYLLANNLNACKVKTWQKQTLEG